MHDIVIVIGHLGAGGSQRVVSVLANSWTEHGLRVCIATHTPAEQDFYVLDPRITRLTWGRPEASAGPFQAVAANIRRILKLRRRLIETGAPTALAFITVANIQTILASIGLGIRVVISERNDPAQQSHGWIWDLLRRRLYRSADLVTANTHGGLAAMKSYVSPTKLAYVPNPLIPGELVNLAKGSQLIISIGRLTNQKGHDVLIQAFSKIANKRKDWRLVIVGSGPLKRRLEGQVRELGLTGLASIVGLTKDPFAVYQNASMFVLPSRFEGMPNALLEAMGCGLPVVVTDPSPGPLEVVENNKSGLVVPVDEPNALAAAMLRLIEDPELRRRLGSAGRKRTEPYLLPAALATWSALLGLREERTEART